MCTFYSILYYTVLYFITLYYSIVNYIILYYIILYYIILYYTCPPGCSCSSGDLDTAASSNFGASTATVSFSRIWTLLLRRASCCRLQNSWADKVETWDPRVADALGRCRTPVELRLGNLRVNGSRVSGLVYKDPRLRDEGVEFQACRTMLQKTLSSAQTMSMSKCSFRSQG